MPAKTLLSSGAVRSKAAIESSLQSLNELAAARFAARVVVTDVLDRAHQTSELAAARAAAKLIVTDTFQRVHKENELVAARAAAKLVVSDATEKAFFKVQEVEQIIFLCTKRDAFSKFRPST